MSVAQPAVVSEAEVEAATKILAYFTLVRGKDALDIMRLALREAAAVCSDDVTTRLTEAADRVAKAEERAEKAEKLAKDKAWEANISSRELWAERTRAEKAEATVQFLWGLLDDIDTVSDVAKGDDKSYRTAVERIQRCRFEVGSTDGYSVIFHGEKL